VNCFGIQCAGGWNCWQLEVHGTILLSGSILIGKPDFKIDVIVEFRLNKTIDSCQSLVAVSTEWPRFHRRYYSCSRISSWHSLRITTLNKSVF